MNSAICTLVEGHYHLGAAALVNSLFHHGFRGDVWIGVRGAMPPWASAAVEREGWRELTPAPGLSVRLVPLTTKAHLTNFKPWFMLDLWERLCPEAERLFYFDPDIVVKCRWSFFEEWTEHGIALVEDVNSPMPESHPRRSAWKTCLQKRNRAVARELSAYANGGYVGVAKKDRGFLQTWCETMTIVGEEIGGLENSMFSFRPELASEANPFSKTDQDALNIAVMVASERVSFMGPEAMDFREGGWTMSHALGRDKPWLGGFVRKALRGIPPSKAAKCFAEHMDQPLQVFAKSKQRRLKFGVKAAALISRFYRRN